jgi:cysteine desulfurase
MRIYLDHAATTPVRRDVLDAMLPFFIEDGFNPSSIHAEGRRAKGAVDDARVRVARVLGARPREIVFTAGGSEADNLAIAGVARARRDEGRHVVSAATEHHAVLHALDALREEGFEVTLLPVDRAGRVDPAAFAAALRPGTVLASVMLANNEIGTLAPVAALAALARERGVTFHTDAVQAPGQVPLDVGQLGVDLLSLSGHKFYGPKGVGILYVREGTPLVPHVRGGGQEYGRRAGTENVAGIAGIARALELAEADRTVVAPRMATLRDRLQAAIEASVPDVQINGAPADRLPNNLSVAFAGVDAEALLIRLDLEGIAASAGSACTSGSLEPSHVGAAIGLERRFGTGVIRFSLGRTTTEGEIDRVAAMLPGIVGEVRHFAGHGV